MKYVSVILDVSIDKSLDYSVPSRFSDSIGKGLKVTVPVRGYPRTGYVLEVKDRPNFTPVKDVLKVHESCAISHDLFSLALWMAKYYGAPLRNVFKTILPSSVRRETKEKQQLFVMRAQTKEELRSLCQDLRNKSSGQAAVLDAMLQAKKGLLLTELLEIAGVSRSPVDSLVKKGALAIDIIRIDRSPLVNEEYFQTPSKTLNPQQEIAFNAIAENMDAGGFKTHLIHGITGSGKTEIYLQSIQKALDMSLGSIVLVPEISLTTQMIERFRCRFEHKIAVLHCRLSHGERIDEWRRIANGEAPIVIGPRSAIFSPVKNPGLIIVDEEHEHTYKQSEEPPYYHARDVAVMRGKLTNSTVVLGSATPSLESFHNAKSGKYVLLSLQERADAASLPQVKIVDMKQEFEKAKGYTLFSDKLLSGIWSRREKGEQSLLFLNRRGFHTAMICQGCREPVKCKSCDLALTYHKNTNSLSCHLCGFACSCPAKCPLCKEDSPMKFRGVGTEQVERALHAIFPELRTIRVDADTTRHKGSHQKLLRQFGSGKADVLIGTQMIAKGLHFPCLTLVGVLNSDGALNIPDFRSSETVFQLITQVAGRSGRGFSKGEVIIQTTMPSNPTILHAAKQDYLAFYDEEIAVREMFNYPPFVHLFKITFSGENEKQTQVLAENFRKQLTIILPPSFELLPVCPSGYAKIKDRYRFQFLVKGRAVYHAALAIETLRTQFSLPKGMRISLDVDPVSTYF